MLEGTLRLEYGDELILMEPGDSIYIYAAISHTLLPAGRLPVKVLSVGYELPNRAGSENRSASPPATPSAKRKSGR